MTDFVDFLSLSFMDEWGTRQQTPANATPTQFPTLNAICGDEGGGIGLAAGWFVTIGGGTGQGKSLLAQNMACHAVRMGQTVGFLSLEMSHHALATRFYAMATGTDIKLLERGRFDPEAGDRAWRGICDLQDAAMAKRPYGTSGAFFVNREPLGDLNACLAAAHWLKDQGCGMIVLDYLQLVSVGDEATIYKQVTEVGGHMRLFAHTEKVTVLALSQYNTPTGMDTSRPPSVYGLMGGGTIANNGDIVLLLDHSRYERDENNRKIARTFLLVPKNRHGDSGDLHICWDYRTLRCREAMPDEENEWPGRSSK